MKHVVRVPPLRACTTRLSSARSHHSLLTVEPPKGVAVTRCYGSVTEEFFFLHARAHDYGAKGCQWGVRGPPRLDSP